MALTVLPVASRALIDACHRLGLETDRLLEEAGLTRAALEDPDARLLASQADALWRAAAGAGTSPALPLQAAAATPFGAFRVLDYLGATGPTLGDGLGRVAGYFPLVDPRGLLRVKAGATRVELLFTAADGGPLPPPAQEYTLAVLFHRARLAMAGELRPVEVRFAFPRPADPREHERAFGLMPSFGEPEAGLVFTRGDWERPTRMTDPGLFTVLEAHARALAARLAAPADLLDRTRAALASAPPGRTSTLSATAARLAVSRRSLQRRLRDGGTSFARLLSEARRERAEGYLRAPDVSIAEVSWLLGFSEQSAFTRAFRRWTGRSPTGWRKGRADTRKRRHRGNSGGAA